MFSETPGINSLRSPYAEADPETHPTNLRRSSHGRQKQKRLQAQLGEGLTFYLLRGTKVLKVGPFVRMPNSLAWFHQGHPLPKMVSCHRGCTTGLLLEAQMASGSRSGHIII